MSTPVLRHLKIPGTPALALLVALGLMACSSGPKTSSSPTAQNSSELVGAGSSFVYPAMSRWISDFEQTDSGVRINYQSIGSGGGIQQLKEGVLDFAASDAALDDQQLKQMPPVVQIPESAGPVCLTYNLPELKQPLRLSSETLAGIYLGKITNWHDPQIRKDNPGVEFPNQNIVAAHRSDGSGTTNIFTTYLSTVNPEWAKRAGKGISIQWPSGLGGKGSEGVTGIVKQSPGAIGYVELTYAKQNNLPTALVRNKAGNWIPPTVPSTTAAINAFSQELAKDVRTPIVDPAASAKDAYPIAGLTYLIIPVTAKTPAKAKEVNDFVKYIITNGQSETTTLSYAQLPPALQQQDETLLTHP